MKITPKDWQEFQHYKNRRPPWIKLYRSLLDDVEFHCLPDGSKALAIMLWLLASESETGVINADSKALAFRLRTTPNKIKDSLKPLMDIGFFVASSEIAGCQQDAIPEKETERETELERETDIPSWLDANIWISFKLHRGKKFSAKAQFLTLKKLNEFQAQGQNPNAILETSIANGWSGVFPEKVNGHGYTNPRDESRKRAYEQLTGKSGAAIDGVSTRLD